MFKKIFFCIPLLTLIACTPNIPEDALILSTESLKMRSLQTRSYQLKDDMTLLNSSVQILQDLGFDIDFTEKKLGILVGSKTADATDYGQMAGMILLAVLAKTEAHWDDSQKIKASFFVSNENKKSKVRITFQRIVWDQKGNVSRLEAIEDPEIYQDFFRRLEKSNFLEENKG